MKNLLVIVLVLLSIAAKADYSFKNDEDVDIFDYLIKMQVSIHTQNLNPEAPGAETTRIVLYFAEDNNQKFDYNLVGTKIARVDFVVDGGTGQLIYEMMKPKVGTDQRVAVSGIFKSDEFAVIGTDIKQ